MTVPCMACTLLAIQTARMIFWVIWYLRHQPDDRRTI